MATSTKTVGTLRQLSGQDGCIGGKKARKQGCAPGRALAQPGPDLGSRAIGISDNGKHVYVASSRSGAVAVLKRNARTGVLKQAAGKAGCIADKGAQGCAKAVGLRGANSLALSPNGKQVYVTARDSNTVTAFQRNPKSGALRQIGCIAAKASAGCEAGVAISAPDVVVASADGRNVYVGSFTGSAVLAFSRSGNGTLTQLGGTDACIAESTAGCATGIALENPEGLAISKDGKTLYAATPGSNAVAVLQRDTGTGALSQATDGTGCVTDTPLAGCATGRVLAGANAAALSPDGRHLYSSTLLNSSIAAFAVSSAGAIQQPAGIDGCNVNGGSAYCRYAREMSQPEGLVVSPDGRNLYVTAYKTGAVAVFDRNRRTGGLLQKDGRAACVSAKGECSRGRALAGVSSAVVSPDGRNLYTTSSKSDAVNVFARSTK